jgi:polyhydroxybutyrate depolymerase
VIIYPQGNARGSFLGIVGWLGWSWNAGGCCPKANTDKVDDITFLSDVITAVSAKFHVDDDLVFAVGISNGGMMANRFACSNDKVKALVALSGPLMNGTGKEGSETFTCSRSVPMMHLHGTADMVIPYDGCKSGNMACQMMSKLPGFPPLPWITVPDAVADWRNRNGIPINASGSINFKNGSTSCMSWGSSHNNVTLCTVGGEGHAWPGICNWVSIYMPGMKCTYDIDGSEHAMSFIRRYVPAPSSRAVVV